MTVNAAMAAAIVESATDYAIVSMDADGRITSWNPGAEHLMQWTAAEAVGQPADLFFTPEDLARNVPAQEMKRADESGHAADERWHRKKDGSRFFGYGELMPLRHEQGGYVKILRDRTREHGVAEALKTSEEELRVVTDALPVLISFVDTDQVYRFANCYYETWFGRPLSDIVGRHMRDVLGDAAYDVRRPRVERALEGELMHFDGMMPTRDGAEVPCDIQYIPRRGKNGAVDGFFVLVIDISERKRAEQLLQSSHRRLEIIAEAMELMNSASSTEELGEVMGRAICQAAGTDAIALSLRRGEHVFYTAEHLPEPLWSDDGFPIDHHLSEWSIRHDETVVVPDVLADDRIPAEARRSAPVRSAVMVSLRKFDSGGAVGAYWRELHAPTAGEVSTVETIARAAGAVLTRIDAENALRALNQDLAGQVSARTAERDRMWRLSTDIMLVADFNARIVAVNPAWTAMLGWTEADLVGRDFMELVHPDDRLATHAETGRQQQGLTTLHFENRYRHKDGSYRWLSWTAVPDERFLHAVGRDMENEKQAAEALRLAEEQLRQSQKMEAIGQLTGGVAHDFNNLLTVIRSSADLLRRPEITEERRRRYVDAIAETADRAAKLTGQLLAFARRQALKPEVFNIGERLDQVADMLQTVVGSRVTLMTDTRCADCFVEADATQFETALVNMAVNARDAMEGEGRLTIAVRQAEAVPRVRGHRRAQGTFVAVSVADTGSGIAPDQVQHIFEPFFTTKEVGKGTGLGLSQVYGFAKQSGGEVDVESRPGEGTTFTLYLPRVAAPEEQAEVEAPTGDSSMVRGHVLLVEDNEQVGEFSTRILRELGFETTWAENGDAALKELEAHPDRFAAVFSDVVMPGMTGVQLGREIRRRGFDLPVVLTSGYSHVLASEGSHGFELLHKPYSVEELTRVLGVAMSRNRSGQR